ncbi:MAG: hypothetical protein IPL22_20330 [Bacteroidetes bacterium]|nr:hypothetical protein [Bacteroidota bacterium]
MFLRFACSYLLPFSSGINAQVVKSVMLDSMTVVEVSKGFNVTDFIEMVKSDTSYHEGFRNLRNNSPHGVNGTMTVYWQKEQSSCPRTRKAMQTVTDRRRYVTIQDEKVTGDFYKRKGDPETYTAEIFDEVFFYKDTIPVDREIVSQQTDPKNENSSHINQLKKLVFNPGAEIDGVPVIGKRMAIFEDHMVPFLRLPYFNSLWQDTVSCYVFSCISKPDAGDRTVVKSLNTWFDRRTFAIVYRDYQLVYSGLLFDFDVNMKIVMDDSPMLHPKNISYKGFWDVPLKKKEKVDFDLNFKM